MKTIPSSPEEDMFSCRSYVKHSVVLSDIYGRENKNLKNAFNRIPVDNLAKSKLLVKKFKEFEQKRGQDVQNFKLLENIVKISKGQYKSQIPLRGSHSIKSLRKGAFLKEQRRIYETNIDMNMRINKQKSNLCRTDLLKSSGAILAHSQHLSKFKAPPRTTLSLPKIFRTR